MSPSENLTLSISKTPLFSYVLSNEGPGLQSSDKRRAKLKTLLYKLIEVSGET